MNRTPEPESLRTYVTSSDLNIALMETATAPAFNAPR